MWCVVSFFSASLETQLGVDGQDDNSESKTPRFDGRLPVQEISDIRITRDNVRMMKRFKVILIAPY